MITKVLAFFGKVWDFLKKAVKFLRKWWYHIINLIVVAMGYYFAPDSIIIGGWFYFLIAYYIFWEIFDAKSLFKKDSEPLP